MKGKRGQRIATRSHDAGCIIESERKKRDVIVAVVRDASLLLSTSQPRLSKEVQEGGQNGCLSWPMNPASG